MLAGLQDTARGASCSRVHVTSENGQVQHLQLIGATMPADRIKLHMGHLEMPVHNLQAPDSSQKTCVSHHICTGLSIRDTKLAKPQLQAKFRGAARRPRLLHILEHVGVLAQQLTWTTSSSMGRPSKLMRGGCTGMSFMAGTRGCPRRRQKGSALARRHSSHRKCTSFCARTSTRTHSQCCHTPQSCAPSFRTSAAVPGNASSDLLYSPP